MIQLEQVALAQDTSANTKNGSSRILLRWAQGEVFLDPRRFRVLVAGRRFGKTRLAVVELIRAVYGKPDAVAWYIGPDRKQAKRIVWRVVKQLTKPYWLGQPNETELSIQFRGGGLLQLLGAKDYDSLRGPGLDFAVLDEYADMAPQAWEEVVRPMLSDRMGRALFIGTPKGYDHLYDLFHKAQEALDWGAYQFTTLDGGNVAASEVEAARQDLAERIFLQEYHAKFENTQCGTAYYSFDRMRNLYPVEYNPRLPVCWSLDFNINPMCSVIAQIADTTTRLDMLYGNRIQMVNVLDEIVLPNSNTREACQEFGNRTQKYTFGGRCQIEVHLYGDATGSARQTAAAAGAESDWEVIRQYFQGRGEYKILMKNQPCNPNVRDRVNAVNSALMSAAGALKIMIHPKCEALVKDLERVTWKPGTTILDHTDPKLTHISDALGYLISADMPLYPRMGGQPGRLV